jgi:hypothetical protein
MILMFFVSFFILNVALRQSCGVRKLHTSASVLIKLSWKATTCTITVYALLCVSALDILGRVAVRGFNHRSGKENPSTFQIKAGSTGCVVPVIDIIYQDASREHSL